MLNHHNLINNEIPNQIKKLPKYRGCLTIEYIPEVFKTLAICPLVVLPEVPRGA